MHVLPLDFYLDQNVLNITEALLGKCLVTRFGNQLTSGLIVETEAYDGVTDKACHAYNNRRTPRTETMYQQGGISYIYLCYGIHPLMNVVTGDVNAPQAVLIRAIEPTDGLKTMQKRRHKKKIDYTLTAGPGAMSQALGITTKHNGMSLQSKTFCICETGFHVPDTDIVRRPRVGIGYAEEHAQLPYRLNIRDNPWVSKAK